MPSGERRDGCAEPSHFLLVPNRLFLQRSDQSIPAGLSELRPPHPNGTLLLIPPPCMYHVLTFGAGPAPWAHRVIVVPPKDIHLPAVTPIYTVAREVLHIRHMSFIP